MNRKREHQSDVNEEPFIKKITLSENDEIEDNEELIEEIDDIGPIEKNQYGIEEYTNAMDKGFLGVIKQR
jgi:phage terminase small subunit